MNDIVLFFTADSGLIEFINQYQQAILPYDMRRNNSKVLCFNICSEGWVENLNKNIKKNFNENTNLICFIDAEKRNILDNHCLFFTFDLNTKKFNMAQNKHSFLSEKIGIAAEKLKVFYSFSMHAINRECLLLPDGYYKSQKYDELMFQVKNIQNFSIDYINTNIRRSMSLFIKASRRPKRKSGNFADKYFTDDLGWCFSYGYERHSLPSILSPHNIFCEMKGFIKYGRFIDRHRHFNVSRDDRRKSQILRGTNCHFERVELNIHTHANIFPSNQCD